ncbi:MAG: phage holin family protein [Dehalococcoidia bacterium]|nr:phage holin family protein [Dehalococcoidia bacterium]
MIGSLIVRLMVNTAALLLAAMIVKSVDSGAVIIADWPSAILAALVYGLMNSLIRPLISMITCLLQLLTLGLFTLVINAGMLMVASAIAQATGIGFQVRDFGAAFITALLITIVSTVLTRLVK